MTADDDFADWIARGCPRPCSQHGGEHTEFTRRDTPDALRPGNYRLIGVCDAVLREPVYAAGA